MKRDRVFCILSLAMILCIPNFVLAASTNEYCVNAEVTDISPSSIEIGEEFTVGVNIEGCGEKIPAEVSFRIINPPTDISIKEALITPIEKMQYANSERFLLYHMKVEDSAKPGVYIIKAKLNYGGINLSVEKDYSIEINVIGEKAEINLASIKTNPVLPVEGDIVELTVRVENSGEGTAKSIRVYADHPFQGIKQSFIGTLEPDEDGPAVFTFIADKPGEFEFPITISFYDDFGEKEIKDNIDITILENKTNIAMIIFVIILVLVIGLGIFYFFMVKRSKDRIIQQLLKGNGNGFKEKSRR